MIYKFETNSQTGVFEAENFADACKQLRRLLPDVAIGEGAWGWVANTNGAKFSINC